MYNRVAFDAKTRQQNLKNAYLNTLAWPKVIQQQEGTIRSKK